MGLLDRFRSWWGGSSLLKTNRLNSKVSAHELRYTRLLSLYLNESPYEAIKTIAGPGVARGTTQARLLRNPANRVGEFYASKLWGGTLEEAFELEEEEDNTRRAIDAIFEASNWGQEKQPAARKYAVMGDMFLKAAENEERTRVYVEVIDPRDVTTFSKDERGNLTYLRLDIPKSERKPDGEDRRYIRTEEWSKEDERLRIWEHEEGKNEALSDLGAPNETRTLGDGASDEYLGIDFLPFVHAKFKDIGDDRGQGAYSHALEKIDEANHLATKLHKMLFPKWPWVGERSGTDPEGRPLPAANFAFRDPANPPEDDVFDVGGEKAIMLPGGVSLKPLIPSIDFASHLSALEAHLLELEKDLPELRYHRINDTSQPEAAAAIRYRLGDLIDKVKEARSNGMNAIEKVLRMAFTIGKNAGIPQFQNIGAYEDGDFDFAFVETDVFPTTDSEEAQTTKVEIENVRALLELGLIDQAEARKRLGIEESVGEGAPPLALAEGVITDRQRELMSALGVNDGAAPAQGADGEA